MSEKRASSQYGGRLLLLFQLVAVALVVYVAYKYRPALTLPLHTGTPYYAAKLSISDRFDLKEAKQPGPEWTTLFPHLKYLVSRMEKKSQEVSFDVTTSAHHTTVSVAEETIRRVGGRLSAVIQARDYHNTAKTYGGDFFIVTLRRPGYPNDGVSCEVSDHMNGRYEVSCILPWAGAAQLRVAMLHPSEGIYHMMKTYSSVTEYGAIMNTTLLNSRKEKEYTSCTIGFPDVDSTELCDYSNPTHGEPWVCIRPASEECSEIIWQQKVTNERLLKYFDGVYFRKGINYNVHIRGSGALIKVSQSQSFALPKYDKNNRYTIALDPMEASGWFVNKTWTSTKIRALEYNSSLMLDCSRNKDIYFIGDSTIRQWFYEFVKFFKIKDEGPDNSIAWSSSRDGTSISHNLTLHYRSHGPPLHNPGPPESRPYITNTIDGIKSGGKGTIVFITLGLHFQLYNPEVFGNRIRNIRESVQSFLFRLPGAQVYIKGLHTHTYSTLCPSAWLSYRFDVMMRHEFKKVNGVTYFDMWDFTTLLHNQLLHPIRTILLKQVGLFLSYIC